MGSRGRLARRTASLSSIFQIIAAAAGASGVLVACSTAGGGAAPDASVDVDAGDASMTDGTVVSDAGTSDSASIHDADAGPTSDVVCGALIVLDDASTDAEDICDYTLTCGLTKNYGLAHAGCTIWPELADGATDYDSAGFPNCFVLEGQGCSDGGYVAEDGAAITFRCMQCFGGAGRRPAGLARERRVRSANAVGAHFAEMARLEAASVKAFDRLANELASHDAPTRLIDAARKSARDEARHAKSATRLAKRFGARASTARVGGARLRSLAALARENAVEGCVRETFGALVNTWQAAHADDADVRAALASIARDETAHAALSWEIAAWAESRLSPSDREGVARARRRALRDLARDVATPPPALRTHAGLPDANARAHMLASLAALVFDRA